MQRRKVSASCAHTARMHMLTCDWKTYVCPAPKMRWRTLSVFWKRLRAASTRPEYMSDSPYCRRTHKHTQTRETPTFCDTHTHTHTHRHAYVSYSFRGRPCPLNYGHPACAVWSISKVHKREVCTGRSAQGGLHHTAIHDMILHTRTSLTPMTRSYCVYVHICCRHRIKNMRAHAMHPRSFVRLASCQV